MDLTSVGNTLNHLEELIASGMRQFLLIGNALSRILKDRLYTTSGYESFERYCEARWFISRAHAYRLIEAAAVASNLSDCAVLPANERQLRPLAKLEPGEQKKAWELTLQNAPNGRCTAKQVEQAIRTLREPQLATADYSEDSVLLPMGDTEVGEQTLNASDLETPRSNNLSVLNLQSTDSDLKIKFWKSTAKRASQERDQLREKLSQLDTEKRLIQERFQKLLALVQLRAPKLLDLLHGAVAY